MGLQARLAQASSRKDGYTNESINAVSQFQRSIETSANPDYDALRAVLAQSRSINLSYDDMMAAYARIAK